MGAAMNVNAVRFLSCTLAALVAQGCINFDTVESAFCGAATAAQRAQICPGDGGTPWPARADFNGDGRTDLLLRYGKTGKYELWFLEGRTRLGTAALTPDRTQGDSWLAVGEADFDRDGDADILWQSLPGGKMEIWLMDGAQRTSTVALPEDSRMTWDVGGTADFNQDQHPDILLWNESTGEYQVWLMKGTERSSIAMPTSDTWADRGWKVGAVGNLDEDSQPDLLLWNPTSAEFVMWKMNGVERVNAQTLSLPSSGPGWRPVGLWDLNQDGRDDAVLQHEVSGELVGWILDGTKKIEGGPFTPDRPTDLAWHAVGPR
jgi:hypothetical protein